MDPYALLGIAPGATELEVRRAFRRAVRELHPDVQPAHLREQSGRRLQAANAARTRVLEDIARTPVAETLPEQRQPAEPSRDGYGDPARWVAHQAWLRQQQHHIDDWNASRPARVDQRRREVARRRHHRVPVALSVRALLVVLVVVALQAVVLVGVVRGAEAVFSAGARIHPVPRTHEDLDLQQVLALLTSWRS